MAEDLVLTATLAVDLIVLTVRNGALAFLAVKRGVPPFRGRWALPGGFVLDGEPLRAAAERELVEETGLSVGAHLEQLATYGDPRRDPRGRVVSVAYLALVPDLPAPVAGTDAADARWHDLDAFRGAGHRLAFDHDQILSDGLERARSKLEYTSLATVFCGDEFTIAELRQVYEAVWGVTLDPRNFHRKVTNTDGFVEPTGRTTARDGGRPAQLFRRGAIELLHPAMLRTAGA